MPENTILRESLRMFENSILFSSILLYTVTNNTQFLSICAFFGTQNVINLFLKLGSKAILPASIWKRPIGADNCGASYRTSGGSNMGFPSGHAMEAFSMSTLGSQYIMYMHRKEHGNKPLPRKKKFSILFLHSIALLISLSRTTLLGKYSAGGYLKPTACHTYLQISAGAALGVLFTSVFLKYFRKYIFEPIKPEHTVIHDKTSEIIKK
jgi:hypothetical protein